MPRRPARNRRTPDRRVVERVHGYLNHMQDAAYVRAAFAGDERRAVRTLASMLRGGDNRTVNDALLFAEDAVRFGLLPRAQAARVWGGLLQPVRDLLRAPDQNLRRNAVVTLGRVGPRTNVRYFAEVLPLYLERDPLTLPVLLGETAWLGDWPGARRAAELTAAHPDYLVRWAVLEWASHYAGEDLQRRVGDVVRGRLDDPHPLIREEAAALLARWEAEAGWVTPPDPAQLFAELDERVAELQRLAPALSFGDVWIRFSNHLHTRGQRDYDLATLDAFVRFEQEQPHPAGQPFDREARASAFEAWRAQTKPR